MTYMNENSKAILRDVIRATRNEHEVEALADLLHDLVSEEKDEQHRDDTLSADRYEVQA